MWSTPVSMGGIDWKRGASGADGVLSCSRSATQLDLLEGGLADVGGWGFLHDTARHISGNAKLAAAVFIGTGTMKQNSRPRQTAGAAVRKGAKIAADRLPATAHHQAETGEANEREGRGLGDQAGVDLEFGEGEEASRIGSGRATTFRTNQPDPVDAKLGRI